MINRQSIIYTLLAALALATLGYGFYAQYIQGFEPCPLCYFQRVVIGTLGIAWLINALVKKALFFQCILQSLISLLGAALSFRHVWIQLYPEEAKGSCGMGIQYMIESYPFTEVILKSWKGTTDCTDASWRIFGLTAPSWLTLLFIGALIISIFLYQYSRRKFNHSV